MNFTMLITIIIMSINLIMLSTFFFIFKNKNLHPVYMGIILFILTILSMPLISMYNSNQMLSFIVFLTLMGGMMVIFLYFTSFCTNMSTTPSWIHMNEILIKISFMFCLIIFIYKNYKFNFLMEINDFTETFSLSNLINNNLLESPMKFINIYIYSNYFTIMFLMIFLFICLTAVVKLCLYKKMAIRKIN
nr:NADH dehydrogenase subunit 6 [Kradibia gibbosae]